MPVVETRVARGDDAAAALEVWRASLAAAGSRPSASRTADVAGRLGAGDALLVVAIDEEQLRGFALGGWVPSGDGFVLGVLRLVDLVVHHAVRRQGIGSNLAEALADAGWARGARRLVATTGDPDARAFLSACGLEPDVMGPPDELVGELEAPVREVLLREDGVRLGQLLKLAGLVETGAEAKALLAAGGVEVDGQLEVRRGRQLQGGEVVAARDQTVRVVLPTS